MLARTATLHRCFAAGRRLALERLMATADSSDTMKAIQFHETGGPEVLHYADVPPPGLPPPGNVLIKNEYAGVNFIDTYFRSGLYPVSLPSGLGVEGAGTVEAAGEGITHVKAGARVAYLSWPDSGPAYAEYSSVPGDKVAELPDSISTKVGAAAVLQGLTALTLVTRAVTPPVQKGDYVLVQAAAGGTGQLITSIANHFGAHVIGTTSTEEKAAIARRAGAKDVILYTKEDVPSAVSAITSGKGVRVVFDGVGKTTFDASLASLDTLGWLLAFGNASGKPDPVDIFKLQPKLVRLMRPSLFGFITTLEDWQALTTQLFELISQGVAVPNIHKVYPVSEAAQAQRDLQGRGTAGKLVLQI